MRAVVKTQADIFLGSIRIRVRGCRVVGVSLVAALAWCESRLFLRAVVRREKADCEAQCADEFEVFHVLIM